MIFYFTGTGNTLWAAQMLAEATGERLLYIPDLLKSGQNTFEVGEHERIGFCFPTHGWQPPAIVRRFVRTAEFRIDKTGARPYVYALTTCGDNMGHAMRIFAKELAGRSLSLDSSFAVVMPESNVCFSFLHLDSAEKAASKMAAAKERMAHVADVVGRRESGVHELVKGAIPYTYTYIIGGYYNKHLITDRKLWVDAGKCIRCGKCQKLCPVGDIAGEPPVWQHNGLCTNCLACYHHCPVAAIHWGKMKHGQYVCEKHDKKA